MPCRIIIFSEYFSLSLFCCLLCMGLLDESSKQDSEQEKQLLSPGIRHHAYVRPCTASENLSSRSNSPPSATFEYIEKLLLYYHQLVNCGRSSQCHRPWVAPATRELLHSAGAVSASIIFICPSLPFSNNNIILHNSGRLFIHSFPFAGTLPSLPTLPSLEPCAHHLAHSSSSVVLFLFTLCPVVSLVVAGLAFFLSSSSNSSVLFMDRGATSAMQAYVWVGYQMGGRV